ncbi:MAG: metal ABC transporter ATP-binding protein [Simkaniaceae bacterium]|nr:metal ABC transporter ATP-binding protein [Simkaniaceae bacterium]
MKEPALKVKGLTVTYDGFSALRDIDFSLEGGRILGVIGPNGAGKSTLIQALFGAIRPLSGQVFFFGKPFKKVRMRVAYVPQKSAIDWDFPITVEDVVLMGAYRRSGLFTRYRREDRETVGRILVRLGMDHLRGRAIRHLSGGERQRLFIARALMQRAELLILDEPFAAVDKGSEAIIMEILTSLRREGKTIVMVHHDLHTVRAYFDSLLVLNTAMVAFGDTEAVFTHDTLRCAYGGKSALFDEALKLSVDKVRGIR